MPYTDLTRRSILGSIAAIAFTPNSMAAEDDVLRVAKSPTCGCCGAWVEHMRNAGFKVEVTEMNQDALDKGLQAELDGLKASRAADLAEMDAILAELEALMDGEAQNA